MAYSGLERRDNNRSTGSRFLCCMMPVITSPNAQGYMDPGVQKLLTSLREIKSRAQGKDEDLVFLRTFLQNQDLMSLLKVHQTMSDIGNRDLKPLAGNVKEMATEVVDDLRCHPFSSESVELQQLLRKPHMKCVFEAHDKIANKDYSPQLPDIPHEVDEDDQESIKIVRLVKNNEPLGATIKINEQTGQIQIARIMHGGAADRSGLITVGDEVQEVNGISVKGRDPADIVDVLTSVVGPITLKLIPAEIDGKNFRESKTRMKAHFSYDPREDKLIPCKEAGLAFKRGDVLHIVNQDDPLWWQARKEGDQNMRAGLIPGRHLQERKEAYKTACSIESSGNKTKSKSVKFSPKLGRQQKKTKKIMYQTCHNEDFDCEEIITYEEVEQYDPKPGMYRPVVLIGPPGVGRNELKRRLISTKVDHFKCTIPHTSRLPKPSEIDGQEYFFISREEMETDIANKRFVEHGEYKGNYYGTSYEQIRSAINEGKVCILTPHPQALKLLRTAEMKPYIIFIKPPSLEQLKATRTSKNAKSAFDEKSLRPFTSEELKEMVLHAARLETTYSHLFDQVIVNDDLETAVEDLCKAVHKIENEPQWVPAGWVR
ncbi:MAGUK p55 subfamily member 7-like isoform X3 [Lineus longissimus]|uniref:MAGUK p55 subfamily member 7-like isoform X3 n=1 Tax=Lineus longissimus TaxID=88925 RepID=UPI00315C79FD